MDETRGDGHAQPPKIAEAFLLKKDPSAGESSGAGARTWGVLRVPVVDMALDSDHVEGGANVGK